MSTAQSSVAAQPPVSESVQGRYLGYPVVSSPTMFIAYTLDGRRVICASPSHAEVRAAIRVYRGGKR